MAWRTPVTAGGAVTLGSNGVGTVSLLGVAGCGCGGDGGGWRRDGLARGGPRVPGASATAAMAPTAATRGDDGDAGRRGFWWAALGVVAVGGLGVCGVGASWVGAEAE